MSKRKGSSLTQLTMELVDSQSSVLCEDSDTRNIPLCVGRVRKVHNRILSILDKKAILFEFVIEIDRNMCNVSICFCFFIFLYLHIMQKPNEMFHAFFKSSIDDLERTKRDLIEELEKRKIHNIYGNSKLTQVEGQKYAKLEIKFEVLHRQIMEMRGMMLKHDIDLLYDFKNSDKPE